MHWESVNGGNEWEKAHTRERMVPLNWCNKKNGKPKIENQNGMWVRASVFKSVK